MLVPEGGDVCSVALFAEGALLTIAVVDVAYVGARDEYETELLDGATSDGALVDKSTVGCKVDFADGTGGGVCVDTALALL